MPLDGTAASYAGTGTSLNAALTTTGAGTIFALILLNQANCTSVTASGLTFTKRAEQTGAFSYLSFWDAPSSGAQASLTITSNHDASASFATLHLWGWSGTLSGLDAHASNPDVGTSDPRTISTSSATTVIFHGARDGTAANPGPGTGFTQILGSTGSGYLLPQRAEFSATQSSLAIHDNSATTPDSANGALAVAYVAGGAPATVVKDLLGGGIFQVLR